MPEGTAELVTHDGMRLHRHRRLPAEASSAIHIVLVHGFGEHGGRYGPFAEALSRRGIAIHAVDPRGHGRSSGRRGHVMRWSEYGEDVDALLEALRGETGRVPFLFGHSMYGLVALDWLVHDASATAARPTPPVVAGRRRCDPQCGPLLPLELRENGVRGVVDVALRLDRHTLGCEPQLRDLERP